MFDRTGIINILSDFGIHAHTLCILYYTVQVEFCYNVAHMCRASSSLVELCSLQCVLSK